MVSKKTEMFSVRPQEQVALFSRGILGPAFQEPEA